MRVTPLPHDRGAIPRDTACVSRDKGRSGGKKTLVFGDPGRASENMNAFTVSRLIFNAGLPSVDVFRPVRRLRSMGLYAGNLWKATRGSRTEAERERERERDSKSDSGTKGVRRGGGGGRGGERLLVDVVRY